MDQNRARLCADGLTAATVLAMLCALFWSRAALVAVAVLVTIPSVALALALFGGKNFSILGRKDAGNLWFSLGVPPAILMAYTLHGHQLIDWTDALIPVAVMVTVGSGLTLLFARHKLEMALEVALVIICWVVYSGSVYLIANKAFDHGQPEVFTSQVERSRLTRTPGRCRVILAERGPLKEKDWVTADRDFCGKGSNKLEACIHRWRGALGAPRFEVRPCGPELSSR